MMLLLLLLQLLLWLWLLDDFLNVQAIVTDAIVTYAVVDVVAVA